MHAPDAVRIAEALGQAAGVSYALWQLGYLHGLKGDFTRAIPLLERGLALAREAQVLIPALHNAGVLSDVLVRSASGASPRS
jgi:hypothetical protein